MWCTATGKLYLSLLPTQTRAKMLRQLPLDRFTENTFTDVYALTAELDTIAKSGVGIDNEEFISETVSVAVPILDKDSRYLASLFVNAPTIRVSLEALQTHVPRLRVAAQNIQTLCYEFEMK
jgi:DNA-binding IclR family transcriptional regulator